MPGNTVLPRIIGEGAMSTVSEVYDPQLMINCAVKNSRSTLYDGNLRTEYHALKALDKPGRPNSIPKVYREFPANQSSFYGFSMEILSGFTPLDRIIFTLPTVEKLLILRDIVKALQFANAKGVVHNDIQPRNIMYDRAQTVLVDWGNALTVNDKEYRATLDIELLSLRLGGGDNLSLFEHESLIPNSVKQWQQLAKAKHFVSPSQAWKDLLDCIIVDIANKKEQETLDGYRELK